MSEGLGILRDLAELRAQLETMRQERNSTASLLEHCGDRLEAERRWRKEMVEAIFTAKELGCECSMVINKLLADQPKGNDA